MMPAALTSDAAARLRELEDRAEITDLVNRYGNGVRLGDAEQIVSCFADDAVVDHSHGETVTGKEALLAYFGHGTTSAAARSVLTFDHKVASTPVMSNVLIDLDGDTAHCESMCLAIHTGFKDGQGKVIVRGTRNIDEMIRTADGWKIRRRVHPAVWAFEVPGTPLADAPVG
jgi:ketosteroid isomerase-like protein